MDDQKNLPEEISLVEKRKGLVGLKYQTIAELLSRGATVKIIAEEIGITTKSLYNILHDKPEIIEEAYRLVKERHKQSDFLLVDLYRTALEKIQEHLQSGDKDIEEQAIAKVLSLTKPPKDGEARAVVNQFFSGITESSTDGKETEETLDEIILRKRKERGLPND